MTFYTEIFNGRDESVDNPPDNQDNIQSRWDSLIHEVPYEPQTERGIPSDREARRDREAWEQNTLPDLRNHELQADFGIPTDLEARRNREIRERREKEQQIREGLSEALSHRLDAIETNYVDNRTDLPGRRMAEQREPMSKALARERIFASDNAADLESCLDVLQNDSYAIEELLYQGFGAANHARATSYGEFSPKNLSEEQTKQLKNFVSFFASAVERGIRIPSEFRDAVTLAGKGDSYPPVSELVVPLGVAIDEIAAMVEEKGTGETSVDNPINELSGANGKEKIGVRELADLSVKAYSTRTQRKPFWRKLSDDTINFPA